MHRESGEQTFFDDLPRDPVLEELEVNSSNEVPAEKPAYERDDCQYCQDGGACVFCERGRQYIKDHPELTKKKKKAV